MSWPPVAAIAGLLWLGCLAPYAYAQQPVGQPCKEEDDPPASFEYRGVQVTIAESCWKRQIGKQCEELVKGWSTSWISVETKKAIDRLKDSECLGPGIRAAAGQRMQSLKVTCKPSLVWCGLAVLNSQTITLGSLVGDKRMCLGATVTHEMLHSHAGESHDAQCAKDVTFSCDQSCFKKNTCQECTGGACQLNCDSVHADLCKTR